MNLEEKKPMKFSLKISMEQGTYNELEKYNRNLIIMKAVGSSEGKATSSARPLAWICLAPNDYGKTINMSWEESYAVYTSTDKIVAGAQINVSNPYEITLGQTLRLTKPNGIGVVENEGEAGSVTIYNPFPQNPGDLDLICGLMQAQNSKPPSQLCAFPLFPKSAEIIAPINKVFVTFASDIKKVGAVVERCKHDGIMLEYKDGETLREVEFDIKKGFKVDQRGPCEEIPAIKNLSEILILSRASLKKAKFEVESKLRLRGDEKAKDEEPKKFGVSA